MCFLMKRERERVASAGIYRMFDILLLELPFISVKFEIFHVRVRYLCIHVSSTASCTLLLSRSSSKGKSERAVLKQNARTVPPGGNMFWLR